ncbi:hypothetical protein [Primorskyibacter flagellatus]|uniref:hypothetical protein n=1 Tax=Primorskyibacter flagellatus TaxID=1387277 RepID=UPI003A912583
MIHAPRRVYGHFGEWMQGRLMPDGEVALITLPCRALWVQIETDGTANADSAMFPPDQLARFRHALRLGAAPWPRLSSNIPPGCGAGASSATLTALAYGAGFSGPPMDLAQACLDIEGATDPLMWPAPDAMIWASRSGRIVDTVPPPPPCVIVGGYWGAPERTDAFDTEFPDISDLLTPWCAAARSGDLPSLGRLASISASRCTALRGPRDPMAELAEDLGALGVVRAHTGSARGLIFRPDSVPEGSTAALEKAGLNGVFQFATGLA